MENSVAAQRTALSEWFSTARAALDHKDWRPAFANYPRVNLQESPVPWTRPPLDIATARFMLVGSAGLTTPDQEPFDDTSALGDATWRFLPTDADLATTIISHEHYEHTSAERDRNVVYPLQRLRELADAGEIGSLTDKHISFMGYQPDWANVADHVAPAIAREVVRLEPDAVILVPV